MSAFGSKRKARKIEVDEDEGGAKEPHRSTESLSSPTPGATKPSRKPFKKSALRQSIAFDDLPPDVAVAGASDAGNGSSVFQAAKKPVIGRSSSIKKKKGAMSGLSFGPGEIISGDAAEALEDAETFTLKKMGLGRRNAESNALRQSLPYQGLPIRAGEDDEERPIYSKDYLDELKNSTPTAPKELQSKATVEDEEELDVSELEGAMVVDMDDQSATSRGGGANIPTEAEIREKKERRARLAHEKDFIPLNDDDGQSRQLSLLLQKKKTESRLAREDEDLGEGFDEFVDDGRISLGKKQEREAKRRHRKEMADMIQQAEGTSDEGSDDSEAERRAAYEATQSRAGMDGLHKPGDNVEAAATRVPPRITPLPVLSECLERLKTTLSTMEQDLVRRRRKMAGLEQEKIEVGAREAEVQALLKQAGERFAALKADSGIAVSNPQSFVEAQSGLANPVIGDRGLESFGNTPVARPELQDVG